MDVMRVGVAVVLSLLERPQVQVEAMMSSERERGRCLGTVTGSSCDAPNNRAVFTAPHTDFTIDQIKNRTQALDHGRIPQDYLVWIAHRTI